jgi:hypothetical protein
MRTRKKFNEFEFEVFQAPEIEGGEDILVKVFKYKKAAERFAAQFSPEQRIKVRKVMAVQQVAA